MNKVERSHYLCDVCRKWVLYRVPWKTQYGITGEDEDRETKVCESCDKRLNAAVLKEILKIGEEQL